MKTDFIEHTWIMLGEIPKIKIQDDLSEEEAFFLEIQLIKHIGRFPNGPLTNMTDGGDGASGAIRTKETRIKQGIAAKVAWAKLTPEQRSEISRIRNARRTDEEKAATRIKKIIAAIKSSKTNHLIATSTPQYKLKMSMISSGTIWITDGTKSRRIKDKDKLPDNWHYGRASHKRASFHWITDGRNNLQTRFNIIPEGWYCGRTPQTGYIWITDGKHNTILSLRNSRRIPEGWRRGKTTNQKSPRK
jgi:hypothetical protein